VLYVAECRRLWDYMSKLLSDVVLTCKYVRDNVTQLPQLIHTAPAFGSVYGNENYDENENDNYQSCSLHVLASLTHCYTVRIGVRGVPVPTLFGLRGRVPPLFRTKR